MVSIDSATNYNNCLSFIAFFFASIATKKKALQKRNGVFCAHAARAPTFEKVGQNNRLVCANTVRDKSKFEIENEVLVSIYTKKCEKAEWKSKKEGQIDEILSMCLKNIQKMI